MNGCDVLTEAEKLLDGGKGWVKGQFRKKESTSNTPVIGYCLLGACRAAAGYYDHSGTKVHYEHKAFGEAVKALADALPPGKKESVHTSSNITLFNDRAEDFEEVNEVLQAAKAKLCN